MNLPKKRLLLGFLLLFYLTAHAQIDVARVMIKTVTPTGFGTLSNKIYSATGFGSFLNFGFQTSDYNAVTIEGGFYYFKVDESSFYMAPCLLGFRQLVTGPDHGFYVEPLVGYTFGDSDLQESNALGNPLYKTNGDWLTQKTAGATTGVGFGYLFEPSGRIRFNIGLRFEHTFTRGDPSYNIFSIRLSHAFSFGRRDD